MPTPPLFETARTGEAILRPVLSEARNNHLVLATLAFDAGYGRIAPQKAVCGLSTAIHRDSGNLQYPDRSTVNYRRFRIPPGNNRNTNVLYVSVQRIPTELQSALADSVRRSAKGPADRATCGMD